MPSRAAVLVSNVRPESPPASSGMKPHNTRPLAAALLAALAAAACGAPRAPEALPAPAVEAHDIHGTTAAQPPVFNGGHPWTEADVRR